MTRKKKKKKKFYLVMFFVILVFYLIFNEPIMKLKTIVDDGLLPVQTRIFNTSFFVGRIKDYFKIIKENEILKFENMRLKERISTLEHVKEENKRLLTILELKNKYNTEKKVKAARIIYRNIYNLHNKFFIDLGEKDEIEVNMAVIYDKYLVGKISKVLEDYSEVELITNPQVMVSVKTNEGMLGISQGSDEEDGKMYFKPSTFEDGIKEGEVLYTSGLSNVYPPGLKVGKIAKVNQNQNYLFESIKVETEYKMRDLREVIVYKYTGK